MRHARPRSRRAALAGRTLIDIVAVLAVMGLLASTAAPAWRSLMAAHRQEAARSALSAHLAYARATAISHGWRVALEPLGPGGWSAGWRVYKDGNANGALDAGEAVLAEHAVHGGVTISTTSPRSRYVGFESLGHPVQASGAFFAETYTICAAGAAQTYRLVISRAGRVKAQRLSVPCG